MTQRKDYTRTTVIRDGDTDIQFDGRLLGEVASSDFNPGIQRWTVLALYQTQAGTYICEQIGCTNMDGEVQRCSGCVADDIDAVIAYFGNGWLAKELYATVGGIRAITHVA